MNKSIGVVFLALLVVALAFAAKPDDVGAPTDTNMTYGQCVSDAAAIRNGCYAAVKSERDACVDAAENATKDVSKACKTEYKQDKNACKKDFKQAKQDCASTYKPGWFARMKSSMK